MTKLAIVILNWNGREYLEKFLERVVQQSSLEGVSLVVADNGSTDDSVEWLKSHFPTVRVIEFEKNWGYTGGYNRALKEIEAKYYLLLNSDIEVTAGWLEPLLEEMERREEVGIAMPKILDYNNREQFEYAGAAGGFIDSFGYPFCRGRILSNLEEDRGQYDQPREIFWASGAAFLIRGSLFHQLGGFDPNFFAHMEEIDLCWRAKREGWQVWIFPQSLIYHVGGGTLPNNSPRKLFLNYRNNLLMLYKNIPKERFWPLLLVRFLMDLGAALIYTLQGEREFAKSLFRAYRHFFKMRREVEREENPKRVRVNSIYSGSIILSFYLAKKRITFSEIERKIS